MGNHQSNLFFNRILREQSFLVINLARIIVSLVFLYIILPLELKIYKYLILIHFTFSMIWTIIYSFPKFQRLTYLGFIPQTLDILVVTIFVMLTGHINSFVSIGYVVIVVFTSIRGNSIFGKTAVILSVLFYFVSGILILYGKIPIVNLFGYITAIQWKGLWIASTLLLVALTSVNQAILNLRFEKLGG